MKTKQTILFTALVVIVSLSVSCKSKKPVTKVEDMTEIKEPFDSKEYQTDAEYFRAVGQAKSQDASFAKTKSESEARAKLASEVQTTMKRVISKYAEEYSANKTQEYNDKTQEMVLDITKQTLNDVKILGNKLYKNKDDSYTSYTAIEANKETIYNGVKNKVSADSKLKIDIDETKFKKIFDEEMKKAEKSDSLK
jgi:outer membrane phospholipase A